MQKPNDHYINKFKRQEDTLDGRRISAFARAILQRHGEPHMDNGLVTPEITTDSAQIRIASLDFYSATQSYTYSINSDATIGFTTYVTQSNSPYVYVDPAGGNACVRQESEASDTLTLMNHLSRIPQATEPTISLQGAREFQRLAGRMAVGQAIDDKQLIPQSLRLLSNSKYGTAHWNNALATALRQGIDIDGRRFPYLQTTREARLALEDALRTVDDSSHALPSAERKQLSAAATEDERHDPDESQ